MNNLTISLILALALVSVTLVAVSVSSDNTDECYSDAIALADTAVTTTDDFSNYTVNSLARITRGIPHNQAELDRVASQHQTNRQTLSEIQTRCGAS